MRSRLRRCNPRATASRSNPSPRPRRSPCPPRHISAETKSGATAYRRLIGTGIAAVSEEASGILSGDAVESGSECLLQRLDGTRGDPAQVDFHLGPSGFDRAQVRAVGGQIAISEA